MMHECSPGYQLPSAAFMQHAACGVDAFPQGRPPTDAPTHRQRVTRPALVYHADNNDYEHDTCIIACWIILRREEL